MVKLSRQAIVLLGSEFLDQLTLDDVYPPDRGSFKGGWTERDGAVLLRGFLENYHGARRHFDDVMDYELAVNGRGVPEEGIKGKGEELIAPILRRGAAFVWEALHDLRSSMPGVVAQGFVTSASVLMDPGEYTGYMTICTVRESGWNYMDMANSESVVGLSIDSEECVWPLPPGCSPTPLTRMTEAWRYRVPLTSRVSTWRHKVRQ